MSLTVTVRTRPGQPTVWLEVAYDGLEPPRALFADLEMIGWCPPVPASPPHSAIDWSTPNPCTGDRFTIRNWRVEGQIIEPPPGSGPRGAWTAAERGAFLRAADGVLRRYGIHVLTAETGSLSAPPTSDETTRSDPPAQSPPSAPANPAPQRLRPGRRAQAGRRRLRTAAQPRADRPASCAGRRAPAQELLGSGARARRRGAR